MMSLKEQIEGMAPELRKRFGLRSLALFGSVAREEDTQDSDIDLLAEFESPTPSSMPERYFGLIEELERRTQHPVQVLTPRMIKNPFFKRSIERDLHYLQ